MINIFDTYIDKSANEKVISTLNSGFISAGKLADKFEDILQNELGIINPVSLNSGTSALHLALHLAGIAPGDEVICSPQTFIASAIAILYCGAKPVFCDIEYDTGNICVESMKRKITDKTKALLIVHWGGMPCNMDPISQIATSRGLKVIEDAAHAPGAIYKNKYIGSISDFTCFSFQAIKHITTGDGGAIACKSIDDYERAKTLRWFGIDRNKAVPSNLGERNYDLLEYGYKYHMNDLSASLGISNLRNFNERISRYREIANIYDSELRSVPGVRLFKRFEDRVSSYWLYGLHVENRESFIRNLKDEEIASSVVHLGIDKYTIFGGKDENLKSQRLFDSTQINLPIHYMLSDADITAIVKTISRGW